MTTTQLPSITHPTGLANFSRVSTGDLDVWFSYETPIAFIHPTTGRVVSENCWGPPPGQHLGFLDGGAKQSKDRRTPRAEFERLLASVTN